MDKCKLNLVGLGEVWWPGKCKILSVNYIMFHPGRVNTEKALAIVLRNDIVKCIEFCFPGLMTVVCG